MLPATEAHCKHSTTLLPQLLLRKCTAAASSSFSSPGAILRPASPLLPLRSEPPHAPTLPTAAPPAQQPVRARSAVRMKQAPACKQADWCASLVAFAAWHRMARRPPWADAPAGKAGVKAGEEAAYTCNRRGSDPLMPTYTQARVAMALTWSSLFWRSVMRAKAACRRYRSFARAATASLDRASSAL